MGAELDDAFHVQRKPGGGFHTGFFLDERENEKNKKIRIDKLRSFC